MLVPQSWAASMTVATHFHRWGYYNCPAGQHIVAFQMQVEGSQGPSDDTAANTVKVGC